MSMLERAKKGAEFLDEELPGWWNHINLSTLELDSFKNCILAQLYGSYFDGRDILFGYASNLLPSMYGFYPHDDEDGTVATRNLEKHRIWVELIKERKEQKHE